MSSHFQYVIVGLLVYLGAAAVLLLVLGFHRREKKTLPPKEESTFSEGDSDHPKS